MACACLYLSDRSAAAASFHHHSTEHCEYLNRPPSPSLTISHTCPPNEIHRYEFLVGIFLFGDQRMHQRQRHMCALAGWLMVCITYCYSTCSVIGLFPFEWEMKMHFNVHFMAHKWRRAPVCVFCVCVCVCRLFNTWCFIPNWMDLKWNSWPIEFYHICIFFYLLTLHST